MAKRKPGKYDHIINKLPKLEHANKPDYQDKVEAEKDRIAEEVKNEGQQLNAYQLGKLYAQERGVAEEIKEMEYRCNLRIEALRQMMLNSQENGEEGWGAYGAAPNTLLMPSGDRLRFDPEIYTNVTSQDEVREFAKKDGLERSLMLPWQTVNSLNKERLLSGQDVIPGTKVYVKPKPVFTPFKEAQTAEEEAAAAEFL